MDKLTRIFQSKPWFLFLFPAFLVLHIGKNYGSIISYSLVWKPILWLFLVTFIIYFIVLVITRNSLKAAAFSFMILLPYFFLADIKDWLHEKYPVAWYSSYVILLPGLFIVIDIFLWWLSRRPEKFTKIILFANLLLLISIAYDAGAMSLKKIADSKAEKDLDLRPCADCKRPDIYYLLFDSYGSSELLKQEFHYDNHDLDSFLSQRGFYIARNSKSNYNFTAYSLASIFNLDYLSVPDSISFVTLKGMLPGVEKINSASLFPALQKMGYKIYNHSIFKIMDVASTSRPFDIWDLSELYNRHQMPFKIWKDIGWNFTFLPQFVTDEKIAEDYTRDRDLNFESAISALSKTVKLRDSKPKFVYMHSLIPHPPVSFDSLGRHVPFRKYSKEEDKSAYLDQLIFANTIIKKLVTEIMNENGRDCIILLQGDHAYRFFDPDKKMEEFKNLNAWYFPNGDYHLLNDSLSSVNSFRLLLNAQFGQKMPILKDSCIFLPYRLSF